MSRQRQAFTAIELIVVIGIITLMTGIAAPSALSALKRGQVNQAANRILELHQTAHLLARSSTDPDVVYGVSLGPDPSGAMLGTVTARRGGATGPLTDGSGSPSKQIRIPATVMVWALSPGSPSGGLAWEYAPGSGAVVRPGTLDRVAVGVDSADSLVRAFGVCDQLGGRAVHLSIFPLGVGHASAR